MGYRFLGDYEPQKGKKKNGALSAPRSSNSSNPFAANNSNKKQAAQPAGATQTTQNTRTTRGTALGGSAVTPVQMLKPTAPKLTKVSTPVQGQQLKLPNIQAFGASMPTPRKQTAEKQTAEKQARKQAEIPEIKALGAGDYSAGAKKLDGFFARAGKTVLGGSKSALASNMDAMGAAYEAGQGQRTRINEAELREAQWAVARAKRDYDLDRSQTSKNALDAALTKMKAFSTVLGTGAYEQALTAAYDAAAKIGMSKDLSALYNSLGKVNVDASTGVQQRATEAARDLAMGVQASGGKDIEAAKKGLGGLGQMVVDVGASMTQTGIDTLLNTAMGTPGSKLPLAFRAFGGATQQARAEGGDTKGQNLYGSAMAAKEVATEMLFNIALPFAKAYGGGALDDIVQSGIRNAVDKLGKTEAGKRALNTLLQVAASGVSEGLEEFIGDWMEWQMPRLYGGEVSSAGETLANALYDFAVGGLSGIGGAAVTPATYQLRMPRLTTYEQRQAAEYRGEKPQNVSDPRIGRLELSSEKYNPSGANVSTVYGNRYRQQVKEDAIRRLGIADGKPAYLVASNITKNGQEYYVDVTKASLNKLLFTKNHEPLELERLLLVDNLEKAIDGSYWAESNGDRKGRTQIDGFDTLRTSFYIDGIPYYADIKVKVVDKGAGQNPQNVAYYIEPEEITSIKKADTQSPTEGRHAPHIFFRDGVSAYMTSVPQSGTGVNIYAKESATLEGNGTDVPNTFTPEAAKPALSYAEKTRTSRYAMPSTQESAAPAINAQNGPPQSFSLKTSVPQAQESVNRLKMPQLVDEQGRTYEERVAWQQIPETQRAAFDEAQRIAQRFGARVVVDQQEGVNGSYRDGVISLNPNAANPVRQTLVHELTHHMESSGLYGDFREKALRYVAENMGADVDSVRQAVMADYARSGVALDEDGATREIVAKFAEEKLFTDEATVRRLLAEDRNLFQRIYDWIRDMAGRLTGTSEESFLRSAEKLYAKALRETTAETGRGTAQYSFEQQPIPTWEQLGAKPDMQVVDIRENGFKLPYAVERNRILNSEEIQSLYRNPPVNKDTGELIFVTPATLTHSFSNSGENSIYATKHLREILENAVLTYAEPSRKADDNSTGVYTLFGAVQTETGIQPVKIKVKEYRIGSSVPKQTIADYFAKEGVVDPYAYAYDERVLALESIEKEELSSSATANTVQSPPLSHPSSSSTIRVQDLLRLVNSEYQKYVPEMANAEMNTVGAVTNNSQLLRGSAPAINSASEFSIPNNSGNVNTEQYSTGRGLDDLAGSSDYLDVLARDENMFTSDAYTLADRLYDLQLRRVQQQEAPPERPAEQAAREDADAISRATAMMDRDFAEADRQAREQQAQQEQANREMPEALKKLGVEPFGTEADYAGIDNLAQEMRWNGLARKQTQRQMNKIPATEKERTFARRLADGTLDAADIPNTVNRETVETLADFYRTLDSAPETMLLRQRRAIIMEREEAKMEPLLGMDVAYDEGGLRTNGKGDRKNSGSIAKQTSTLRRNLQTPARICATEWGPEHGKKVYEALFYPVTENNGRQIDWVNSMLDRVRTFKDSKGEERPLNRKERELVQKIVEHEGSKDRVAAFDEQYKDAVENVRNGASAEDAAKMFGIDPSYQEYQDLQNYETYLKALEDLHDSKSADDMAVGKAVDAYSKLYKELYDGINSFLVAHGYQPIGFIEGYTPHMQPEAEKTAFSKALKLLGLDDTAMSLPTSISGKTADLKPYKQYNPFFQERHGVNTEYDIAKGFEEYVYYLGNIFYHTDDIMRIRTAEKYIRKTYSSEEASEQISRAESARDFTDDQIMDFLRMSGVVQKGTELASGDARVFLEDYIGKLYDQIGNITRYSEMAKYLDNYANRLAGKQNMADRGAEAATGRGSLNWINTLTGKYGGAKLAFNISSALNQTSQIPMVAAENGERATLHAIGDFFKSKKDRAAFVQESNFLKGKKGIDWLLGAETKFEKVKEFSFSMIEMVDSFTSYVAVRSKYLKEIKAGKSHADAMKLADEYGRNVMGSRARGEKPMLFDTKNPFWQIVTRFQLEALNSWEHVSRDLPNEVRQMAREKGKAYAAGTMGVRVAKYLTYGFLLNLGIGALSGGSPVPYDVIGSVMEALGKSMGVSKLALVDNVLEAIFDKRLFGTDGDDDDDAEKDWWAFLESLWGDVANDIPVVGQLAALAGVGDETLPVTDLSKVGDFAKSVKNNGVFSGDALDKGLTAASEFMFGGNQIRKTIQGGKTVAQGGVYSKGKLRYQVDQTPGNIFKGVLFGRSALNESQAYYAERTSDFSENQTEAFRQMQDRGVSAKASYDLLQELRGIEKTEEPTKAERQRDALRQSSVSGAGKWVTYYQTMASEKEWKTMDAMQYNSEADYGTVTYLLMDMKDMETDAEKMRLIDRSRLSDNQKASLYKSLIAGDEDLEKINALKDAGISDYQYLQYKIATSDLTKKEAKLHAINTLDLTDSQKDALYYLNSYASSKHWEVPWEQGISAMGSDFMLTIMQLAETDDGEDTPKWQQSLNEYMDDAGRVPFPTFVGETKLTIGTVPFPKFKGIDAAEGYVPFPDFGV